MKYFSWCFVLLLFLMLRKMGLLWVMVAQFQHNDFNSQLLCTSQKYMRMSLEHPQRFLHHIFSFHFAGNLLSRTRTTIPIYRYLAKHSALVSPKQKSTKSINLHQFHIHVIRWGAWSKSVGRKKREREKKKFLSICPGDSTRTC